MKTAQISGIACYLPKGRLNNEELVENFSGWTPKKIEAKLGIRTRPVSEPGETALDMAVKAAQRLFASGKCSPDEIDFVILCTQSPDYFLPSSACIIQERLGLSKRVGAFDFDLGCSGFVYGLAIAKGLIETEIASNILFLTSETYTKYINVRDRASRPLFGDAAAAVLIRGAEKSFLFDSQTLEEKQMLEEKQVIEEKQAIEEQQVFEEKQTLDEKQAMSGSEFSPSVQILTENSRQSSDKNQSDKNQSIALNQPTEQADLSRQNRKNRLPDIGPFELGTDGSGADMLIVPAGAHRLPSTPETAVEHPDGKGSMRSKDQLFMHGSGIFLFAADEIPIVLDRLFQKCGLCRNDVDLYVFHQANYHMLTRLREVCQLEECPFFNNIMERGNTVSSSIPIAMADAWCSGEMQKGQSVMLVGFGVGLSWGATMVRIPNDFFVVTDDGEVF